ncbi:helix-turn-helix transcriptional regulator [Nocardia sp. NPDC005825]|uniref:helix-turn-helix transcriptional regulator n=1 Tax=unclassified Nocardia TaxID=2637762 RepID=UPI0033FCC892
MTSPLRLARLSLGYRSQEDLAKALNETARSIGLRIAVTKKTIGRWESDAPPWPQADHAQALQALFNRPIAELGFTSSRRSGSESSRPQAIGNRETWASRHAGAIPGTLPQSVASDFMSAAAAYRRMYWSVPADRLQQLVATHSALGWDLLEQVPGSGQKLMARAVAETSLLTGRLEFFDLQQPQLAVASFGLALRAAGRADDALLGAATLAHMAFAPAFANDSDDPRPQRLEAARESLRGARVFAERGDAGAEMIAWLDAVEAEVETRIGGVDRALELLDHAERTYAEHDPDEAPSPVWLDWFSPARLAGFKGNTQIAAGQGTAARDTLERALADLPIDAIKQRAVLYADLAAAESLDRNPEKACAHLGKALELLGEHWYATAMDRVRTVRQTLREWDSLPAVRDLDDQLYNWHTMIRSLAT